jgi:hypothetical protein
MIKDPARKDQTCSEAHTSPDTESPDLTRREWLLRLGGTAVLMGFQGSPVAGASGPDAVKTNQLPPGLYYPSEDHMTHALESDGRFRPIPTGSETDFLPPPGGPFAPQFFSLSDFKMVRSLVALVLGESESSGEMGATTQEIAQWIDLEVYNSAAVRKAALDLSPQHRTLAVAFYGEDAVTALETHDPQKIWKEGLDWIARESNTSWSKPFIDASPASQSEILRSLNERAGSDDAGTRLFVLLKNQVGHGFYTSQRGLKELDYKGNAFYAECPGCNVPDHPK